MSDRQERLEAHELPPALTTLARGARKIVEVGVGRVWATALAMKAIAPRAEIVVTDVRADALAGAPRDLVAVVDDVTRPTLSLYDGAAIVYGVRLPEELQVPTARLARKIGAAYAARALKDEWADVSAEFPRAEPIGGGWRLATVASRER
ncbi:MAG: UPF0146 family protein [Thermoplasmatota archaeon]